MPRKTLRRRISDLLDGMGGLMVRLRPRQPIPAQAPDAVWQPRDRTDSILFPLGKPPWADGRAARFLDELPPDVEKNVKSVSLDEIAGKRFCLTGDFYCSLDDRGPVIAYLEEHGGIYDNGFGAECRFLVVGSLGSLKWKNGTLGRKIGTGLERLGSDGWVNLRVVHEFALIDPVDFADWKARGAAPGFRRDVPPPMPNGIPFQWG